MAAAGIQRSLLVQADSSTAETAWLLELAKQNPTIAGVVGWVNLAVGDLEITLNAFQEAKKFKGVRPDTPEVRPCHRITIAWIALVGTSGIDLRPAL